MVKAMFKLGLNILYVVLFTLVIACSSIKNIPTIDFTKTQISLINAADTLTPMRVYKITNTNDSLLLRTKSEYIKPDPKNPLLNKFIARLHRTVTDSMSLGVGIAAPQVGILKNIILVKRFDKTNFPFEAYLNPVITNYSSKKQTYKEGCLSIPNRFEVLNTRSQSIIIEYDTTQGSHIEEIVEGFTAVIFQHEIDHLNGILYLDHFQKEIRDAKKAK